MTASARPWVVVTDYPAWPSPYFRELHEHTGALQPQFAADLEGLHTWPGPPGVVNLHRLKRLYRDQTGTRTPEGARRMLDRLQELATAGWKVVWTVHNLFPIDGPPGEADHVAAHGVLGLADGIITHTRADAAHLAALTDAPITVAGWAGLSTPPPELPAPAHLTEVAERIRAHRTLLMLGNLTDYKGLPAVVRAFLTSTTDLHLAIIGPERSPGLRAELHRMITGHAEDRVHLVTERVHPHHTAALYAAAGAALCPYRTDGAWDFFTRVLHPSSVGTALGFGCPVIAPDLPAVTEMTHTHPRLLYPHRQGPEPALAAWQATPFTAAQRTPAESGKQWRDIGAVYARLAHQLWDNRGTTHRHPGEGFTA